MYGQEYMGEDLVQQKDIFQKTGQERVDMWELGTIEGVGNLTCSREPFPHRASAHDEHKISSDDDILIFTITQCNISLKEIKMWN